MNPGKLTVTLLAEGFWQINETADWGQGEKPYVDAYLLTGEKKALLIDSLMQSRELYAIVRKLTDLPVEVVLTHGHIDHAGKSLVDFAAAGHPIYLHPSDLDLLWDLFQLDYPSTWFSAVQDGDVFDLGGCQLQVLAVPGHSPGCLSLLDAKNQRLFCGDSLGSGTVWMHIPYTLTLSDYLQVLQKLKLLLQPFDGLSLYPGHREQAPDPMTLRYLDDLITVVHEIVAGHRIGRPIRSKAGGREFPGRTARFGQIESFCFDPKRILSNG